MSSLSKGQLSYWHKRLGSGASLKQILKKRNHQIQQHNPNFFGQDANLSPLQLKRDVNAGVKAKYGQAEAGLQQVQNAIPGWYQAYRDQLNAAKGAQSSATSTLQQQLSPDASPNSQVSSQTAQQLRELQQQALSRGGAADPNLAGLAAGAAKGQNQAQATAAASAGSMGNATQLYLDSLIANSQLQQGQGIAFNQQKLSAMKQEAGAYGQTLRANEIKAAQNYGLGVGALKVSGYNAQTGRQNANTAGMVAGNNAKHQRRQDRLGQDKLAEQQGYHASLVALKRRAADLADSKDTLANTEFAAKYGITPGHFNSLSDKQKLHYLKKNKISIGKSGGLNSQMGGPSASELSSSRKQVGSIYNALHDLQRLGSQPFATGPFAGKKPNPQQLDSLLIDGKKYSPIVVQAAKEINQVGYLSRKTYSALIHSGVLRQNLRRWRPNPKPGAGALAEPNT